ETREEFGHWEIDTVLGHKSDRKSTRLNSSHVSISYAVFCLKKKKKQKGKREHERIGQGRGEKSEEEEMIKTRIEIDGQIREEKGWHDEHVETRCARKSRWTH